MRRAARDPEGARLVTSRRVRLLAAMRPGMVPNRLGPLLADLRGRAEELLHRRESGLRVAAEIHQAPPVSPGVALNAVRCAVANSVWYSYVPRSSRGPPRLASAPNSVTIIA